MNSKASQPTPLGAELALDIVANRWFVRVAHALMPGPKRYGALQREIPKISRKMLTQTLRAMERDGFVDRKSFAEKAPHTEYSLTEFGWSIIPPLRDLCHWSEANFDVMEANRARFDERGHSNLTE